VPERADPVFAAAVNVTVAGPVPEEVPLVNQLRLSLTFQPQPAVVVTLTASEPPAVANDRVVGDTVYEQLAAAWFTVTVCPATVTVPLRVLVDVLAATKKVAVPFPVPLPVVIVIQLTLLLLVQLQFWALVTVMLYEPPLAPGLTVVGDTV
jgi:hypothetical protein